jgi:hypothetical protein
MCLHETKNCQRCNIVFECKPGSITQCQCFEVALSAEQRAYLEQRYNDCLCKNCLLHIKGEFELFKEKFIFQ